MSNDLIRFILITVPPPDVAAELETVRTELNAIAGSRAALSYPPHVTLRTGFLVPKGEIEKFIGEFGNLLTEEKTFRVQTDGIHCGFYEQNHKPKPIVYFRIRREQPLLALNRKLLSYQHYRKSDRTRFDPHLTIAYKDLSLEGLERLRTTIDSRPDLRRFEFGWLCDHAGLYVKKGEKWQPHHLFSLSNDPLKP